MNKRKDISDELKEMGSVLNEIHPQMPCSVPSGYFENLTSSLRNTIQESEGDKAEPQWGKNLPFTTPLGYFEGLTNEVNLSIEENRLLGNMPKALPFIVPTGYFEQLPEQLQQKVGEPELALTRNREIPLFVANKWRKHLKWAVAALLVLAVGAGSIKYFAGKTEVADNMLASVPHNELVEYVQGAYRLDVDKIVSNTTVGEMAFESKDIEQYLNETGWDIVE